MADRAPIDPASLTAPVRSLTVDGIAYAWDEPSDPAWTGEWAFPATGWGDADRTAWVGTQGHLIAVKREHAATLAAGDAYATSPAFLLANARAEVEETIRAKEIDQRRLDGAKAWTVARTQHGTNVRAISCVTGDVVIIVAMNAKEIDGANTAARLASETRLRADPDAKAIALADYVGTQRDWMLSKCIWPDKDRIKAIADEHPSLWNDLADARDDMARARVADEGKGFAP